jgi:hypothetical protein
MRSFLIAAVLAMLPSSGYGQVPQESLPCVDVAVVARLARETPEPLGDVEPDAIVLFTPWREEFEIEEIILGQLDQTLLSVTAYLHIGLTQRHQADHFLLLLRRTPDRGYILLDFDARVLRDRRGRFIIPLAHPEEQESLRPEGWLPVSCIGYLRPIRYDVRRAWWLAEPFVDDDVLAQTPAGWHTRRGHRIVALRGLYLRDLNQMMANEAGAICRR